MCKESVASVGNVKLDSFTVDKDDYVDDMWEEDAVRRVATITLNSSKDWQQQLLHALSEVYSVCVLSSSENTYPVGVWIKPKCSCTKQYNIKEYKHKRRYYMLISRGNPMIIGDGMSAQELYDLQDSGELPLYTYALYVQPWGDFRFEDPRESVCAREGLCADCVYFLVAEDMSEYADLCSDDNDEFDSYAAIIHATEPISEWQKLLVEAINKKFELGVPIIEHSYETYKWIKPVASTI